MIIVPVVLYILVYLLPLDIRPLTRPDETRYAEIPYEMLISGDWVTPRLNGLRYFEKPPLGYWLSALSLSLLGQTEFAVRFSSVLATGCTALLLYFFSLKFFSSRSVAGLSAFVYLTFSVVYLIGTHATLDSLLTLLLSAGIMSYAIAALEVRSGPARGYWLASGLAFGGAFLAKGFLAFAVPLLVLVPWLIWQGRWRALFVRGWVVVILAVLVIMPWAILIHQREADFWHYFFWVEHIKRFTADNAQHREPFYFYLMYLPVMLFPWVGLLPAALGAHVRSLRPSNIAINRLLWLWVLVPLLFFSSSSGKLATYILPCFPPLAIIMAHGLHRYFADPGKQRQFKWGIVLNLLVMSGLLLIITYWQLAGSDNALYRSDETLPLVLLQASIVITLLSGLFCLAKTSWRIRSGLMASFLLPLVVLSTVALPARVVEAKSPGRLLLEIAPLIGANSRVVSEGSVFRSVSWYLGRQDVYLLDENEVAYGLGYPDSTQRLLTVAMLGNMIRQPPHRPIALFCHSACPEGVEALVPPGSLRRRFGSFRAILIE